MNSAKIIATVIVVIVLGGGGYALVHHKGSGAANPNATTSPTTQTNNSSTPDTSTKAAATITFNDSGFSPAVTTVKAGDTVQVTNASSSPMDFDSDPHPTHTDELELNIGEVDPGKSQTFKVTKVGHWGFHDHLDPSLRGTLVVTQ